MAKRKLVYGVGVNDADYVVKTRLDGKQICCPFYVKWRNMLMRCYCEKYLEKKPTYLGCKVCKDWLTFSKFKSWTETQDWEGKELDKDLLGDGKLYSPETSVFVSNRVNSFTIDSGAIRGDWSIGVSKQGNRFKAQIKGGDKGHIGMFDTPEEAHQAWRVAKIKIGERLIEEQTDLRVKQGLRRYLDKL